MGKRNLLQRLIILPILGLLFATILAPLAPTPVSAIPEVNTSETTELNESQDGSDPTPNTDNPTSDNDSSTSDSNESTSDSNESTSDEDEEDLSCFAVVESLGWAICPVTNIITNAVDALYGIISKFLIVEPISFNDESAIYIVWGTARDIANVVFIIFILVVIFSQLTGVGFDNYNIKKTLPRIIIAAILVNISFLICSLAVDTSNVIGASVNGFFENITNSVKASGAQQVGELTWTDLIGKILGTAGTYAGAGLITVTAIKLAGGVRFLIWPIIFVLFSAIISLAIGLFTIALRQAVIALLIMIAPLAFVAYLLPNTEQYFKKWKDTLLQMLIFFPMFAALYGASNLAGWTFIINGANGEEVNVLQIIVGLAIQVVPLIVSFKLMQMSNTILGKVSDTLNSWSQPLRGTVKDFTDTQGAIAKAKYDAENLSRPYTGIGRLDPSRARSYVARKQAERAENRRLAEDTRQKILQEYTLARQMNKEITFDENGRRVLSDNVTSDKMNGTMSIAMQNKEAALNLSHMEISRERALGQSSTYAEKHGINDETLSRIAAHQADNYIDLETQTNAKRRDDIADKKWYAEQVLKASQLDENGKLKDRRAYERLVVNGGGVDALKDYDYDTGNISNNATASVIANAYDFTEAERENEMKRFTTYLNTQATQTVESAINDAIDANDVNNLIAGLNVLDIRGDDDALEKYVRNYMNTGKLKLGTEDANNLAKALIQIKKAPVLRRLGKYINVETRQFTNGARGEYSKIDPSLASITYDEYTEGVRHYVDADGNVQEYTPKGDIISYLEGTAHKDMERTAMQALIQAEYGDGENKRLSDERIREINKKILPQLVTAVPSYDSGSEPLISIVEYITGMKRDAKDGNKWKTSKRTEDANNLRKDVDFNEFAFLTRQYLSSFTANDLISMKSDMLGAVQALFAEEFLNNNPDKDEKRDKAEIDAYVKSEFKKIFSTEENIFVDSKFGETISGNGVLDQLMSGDSSAYNGMKNPLRKLLDLAPKNETAAEQAE